MRRMITFDEDHIRFTNRVVGITCDRGRVLLHRVVTDDFWALPGGRAELLEPAAETLRQHTAPFYQSLICNLQERA